MIVSFTYDNLDRFKSALNEFLVNVKHITQLYWQGMEPDEASSSSLDIPFWKMYMSLAEKSKIGTACLYVIQK